MCFTQAQDVTLPIPLVGEMHSCGPRLQVSVVVDDIFDVIRDLTELVRVRPEVREALVLLGFDDGLADGLVAEVSQSGDFPKVYLVWILSP